MCTAATPVWDPREKEYIHFFFNLSRGEGTVPGTELHYQLFSKGSLFTRALGIWEGNGSLGLVGIKTLSSEFQEPWGPFSICPFSPSISTPHPTLRHPVSQAKNQESWNRGHFMGQLWPNLSVNLSQLKLTTENAKEVSHSGTGAKSPAAASREQQRAAGRGEERRWRASAGRDFKSPSFPPNPSFSSPPPGRRGGSFHRPPRALAQSRSASRGLPRPASQSLLVLLP